MAIAASPNAQRIKRYLRRKSVLVDKIEAPLTRAAEGLVAELCAELRRRIPETPDAVLLEMLMSGIGIDRSTGVECRRISDRYLESAGLGIVGHRVQLTEAKLSTVLYLAMEKSFSSLLTRALGDDFDVVLEATLSPSQSGVQQVRIPDLQRLDLADLEKLHATLDRYGKARSRPPISARAN